MENIPNNYRLNVRLTFPKLRAMSDKEVTIDEILELVNHLSSADRKRVRRCSTAHAEIQEKLRQVIKSVGDHLLKHDSITSGKHMNFLTLRGTLLRLSGDA